MYFLKQTIESLFWLMKVLKAFLRIKPFQTCAIISIGFVTKITHTLAFLLPLKVILLAGSPAVPRYFQFIINDENKMPWIIGLSVAAIVFYLITLVLEAFGGRLSAAASKDVVSVANKITVFAKQHIDYYFLDSSLSFVQAVNLDFNERSQQNRCVIY